MYSKNDFMNRADAGSGFFNQMDKRGMNSEGNHLSMVSPMPGSTPPNGGAALEESNRDMAIIHQFLRQNDALNVAEGMPMPQSNTMSSGVQSNVISSVRIDLPPSVVGAPGSEADAIR